MTRRARAIATLAISACVLVPAGTAGAWNSNTFSSPTGNIRCKYDPRNEVVSCLTLNDNWVAAVSLWGRAYKVRGGYYTPGQTLAYGDTWTVRSKFRCWSRTAGMTCKSLKTGHGFFTSRATWRFF
ncbi:MAG: hypothetical protein MUE51_04900 [Thermoleophilia bacterium]|nr:hypothetical protein [Thermoleophilia bacterium]